MKTVSKSVLIWHSARQMFDLVAQVERYPQFLPWCDRATVLQTHEDGITAEIGISFGGLRQSFTTRNTQVPGREVVMRLVEGPFSQLDGTWTFAPIGEGEAQACRVSLELNYDFRSTALALLVGPVFDMIANSLVDAFVKRAEELYG